MIEKIEFGGIVYAVLIRDSYDAPGISFVTPDDYSQQLAYMRHPAGKQILPHLHNRALREVSLTQEVLVIKSGKIRVDFFSPEKTYLGSKVLSTGDVILLVEGGHGFEVIEDCKMVEIKQGPYLGDQDKKRFTAELKPSDVYLL